MLKDAQTLVEIKDLRIGFAMEAGRPPKEVVAGVTLEVRRGQWTSVVGPSGSGKSVTVQMIGRLLKPDSVGGSIRFFENDSWVDLLTLDEDVLRVMRSGRFRYIFQDPAASLNPVLRIGDQLLESVPGVISLSKDLARQ
ncbi:MAG: ATP-binding cassette domain-containing protein, partial [Candidatus Omnitrophota bacterium]